MLEKISNPTSIFLLLAVENIGDISELDLSNSIFKSLHLYLEAEDKALNSQ